MFVRFLSVVAICILMSSAVPAQRSRPAARTAPFVKITSHKDAQGVKLNPIIRGTVFSSKAAVWVIVHPMETEGYWVQAKATVRSDGKFYSQIFVGRDGNEDSGKHFEIRAVANPKKPLARGGVLEGWPQAQARSEIVELVRE
jgi:hypothetical protein